MRPSLKAIHLMKVYSQMNSGLANIASFAKALNSDVKPLLQNTINKVAVNDVSLELKPGDRLGIVGRNGAGKSTLLNILAGITEPTSGTLQVNGHVTAILTLGLGLREDLSGRENIYIDGEVQGKTRAEVDKVIDEIIAFSELEEFIDYPVRTYSTGMKARLAFSMIITIDPEILIIDEALSVGDMKFSEKASAKIKEICNLGKIVIIVSHGLNSITEMCNRCIWMDSGKIVMDGEPVAVTDAYRAAVRKEDEAELQQKFYQYTQARSLLKGNSIAKLEIVKEGSNYPQLIFATGDHITIQLGVETNQLKNPDLKLQIERLDGLKVNQSYLSNSENKLAPGRNEFEIQIKNLPLIYGIYKVTVCLMEKEEIIAENSTVIEVYTEKPPTGGKPALIYPGAMTVETI